MTDSEEDPRNQLHVRLDSPFKQRVESYAEAQGISQTKVMLTALEEFLPVAERVEGPTSQKLREPYFWLREHSDDRLKIDVELAMTELAQELGMSKPLVRKSRLEPLQRRGWIKLKWGTITVIIPEERDE